MTSSLNPLRERLGLGQVGMGLGLRLARSVESSLLLASCGYDWLFIDLEHGPMSLETAAEISVAALGAGIAPIARIPAANYTMAARILDAGAWGVLMSHVNSVEDARETVRQLKFPPAGHRSVSYSMPQLRYAPMRQTEASRRFNDEMLLGVMIESPEAVEHASEIAAVPGVDALFVGANDLTMTLGIAGEFGHTKVADACQRVIAACRVHHKWPGVGGVYTEDLLHRYIGMGMRLVLGGTDFAIFADGARQRADMIRRVSP